MDKYGLIGEKLSHSFSKIIHEQFFGYEYKLTAISQDKFPSFMKARNFRGINVTIPYKQAVIPYLDVVDKKALEIGAVNTVINKGSKLYGYNTDYAGVLYSIKKADINISGETVLILGSGGTAKTIKAVLKDLSAKKIVIASRNPSDNNTLSYQDCIAMQEEITVIFNATPVGMYPNAEDSPIDLCLFKNIRGVVDVIYNPLRTRLLQQAEELSIKNIGGLFMLCTQAKFAAEYFLDKEIEDEKIDEIYSAILKKRSNLVLIGMPGCGKSHLGFVLSRNQGRKHIDTDNLIAKQANMPISEIFRRYGEEYFRELETELTKKASLENFAIISTGGGTILSSENIFALKQNGILCFIDRPIEKLTILKGRPLSKDMKAIEELDKSRRKLYEKYADFTVINDGTFENTVDEIALKFDEFF